MSWTAELKSAVDRKGYWKIQVVFTDDVAGRTADRGYRFYGVDVDDLRVFVRQKALEFNRLDETIDFTQYIGRSIDVTPPVIVPPVVIPPTPPTAAEIAEFEWLKDYRRLKQMLIVTTDIPALATTQANNAIAALRTSLETDWLNSYLDGIR